MDPPVSSTNPYQGSLAPSELNEKEPVKTSDKDIGIFCIGTSFIWLLFLGLILWQVPQYIRRFEIYSNEAHPLALITFQCFSTVVQWWIVYLLLILLITALEWRLLCFFRNQGQEALLSFIVFLFTVCPFLVLGFLIWTINHVPQDYYQELDHIMRRNTNQLSPAKDN